MKFQFIFLIIIILVLSGCQTVNNNRFAVVVTPVFLPVTPEKGETAGDELFKYISLYDYLKSKNFRVDKISNNPEIYKIPAQKGLLEELAKILRTLTTTINVYDMNLANINTTKTDTGEAYRRKGVIINDDFEIEKIEDIQGEFKIIYDPGHPDADSNGYVSYPNVSRMVETLHIMNMQSLEKAIIMIIEKINRNSVALTPPDYHNLHNHH